MVNVMGETDGLRNGLSVSHSDLLSNLNLIISSVDCQQGETRTKKNLEIFPKNHVDCQQFSSYSMSVDVRFLET